MFHAGKCSRATLKPFIGLKWPLSGILSSTDLQYRVSARPSEHAIKLPLLARHEGKSTKLSFSGCLHSDKGYFTEGVMWTSPQRAEVV